MGSLGAVLRHPEEIFPMLKLKMEMKNAEKQVPEKPHWAFCYTMLRKVSRSFAFTIQQLDSHQLRDSILILYLVLRALDTTTEECMNGFISTQYITWLVFTNAEDDTSLTSDVRVRILEAFYCHIDDPRWYFSCGTDDCKVLMENFHYVQVAFLELKKSHQDVIKDVTKRMGAGMAKFICKEIETIEDLNEYAHYVAGLIGIGLSKLFYASGLEDLAPDSLSNSMGLFLQKVNIIRDYLEDINEIPEPRLFWPRQVWSKYVVKLEELKYEEKSTKGLQCLNEMVTNALVDVEHSLKYLSALRDPSIFRFCAIPMVVAIGTLTLCYNNPQVFRATLKLRRGLIAKLIHQTRTMSDVHDSVLEFTSIMKAKVEMHDPNASTTLSRLDAIQKICRESELLNNSAEYYTVSKQQVYHSVQGAAVYVALCLAFAYLSSGLLNIALIES
ncbi:hypothetical protein L6164_037542 [Bauhinia variegata]|uniref:Uncharacterized protein n=1 Tax=Bauhinia variegata TaxID=167791 RepID=A0ACB9KKH0_BAUVA|nr:hypothetical protein L6164_037542 [Bauhinia variegata]